ncbi:addiction module protein [Phytoactinopolyspora halophila]|uniref:addiction module protein n=1 Tax=Phytoactinopolyspora halophila TaxID=1981511 RepID=UPI000F4D9D96|nr:addiction module protein [Phytoactinopolyspora halophila]
MTRQAQDLLQAALELPVHDRAHIAAELLASLHDRPEADQQELKAAWAHEIERRGRRATAADSAGEAWANARARLASCLDQR